MHMYGVQPLESWEMLPKPLYSKWRSFNCDNRVYKVAIQNQEPLEITVCDLNNTSKVSLIAIMAATSSRGVASPSTQSFSIFTMFLPSLVRTVDCGFRYMCVLGYDVGDAYFDSEAGLNETRIWFDVNVKNNLVKNNIEISLLLVRVDNTNKKPGPVFIKMAVAAYNYGAHYFYRVNDDTEMLNKWPTILVKALESLPLKVGVVGPTCKQGNLDILTHDFVHRTHMEIFENNYYPQELTDWWMDDWMTTVYGVQRTLRSQSVHVINHIELHGKRYEVELSNWKKLKSLVIAIAGRGKIVDWMSKMNVMEGLSDRNFSGLHPQIRSL